MKLTKETLKQIIKEELDGLMNESGRPGPDEAELYDLWIYLVKTGSSYGGESFITDGWEFLQKHNPTVAQEMIDPQTDEPSQKHYPGVTRERMMQVVNSAQESAERVLADKKKERKRKFPNYQS